MYEYLNIVRRLKAHRMIWMSPGAAKWRMIWLKMAD